MTSVESKDLKTEEDEVCDCKCKKCGSALLKCIEEVNSMKGFKNGFSGRQGFDFLDINVDPRIFKDIIDKSPEMPKILRNAIINRVLELSSKNPGLPCVLVTLNSRVECRYPPNWIDSLACSLVHHRIFVNSDDFKFSHFSMLTSAVKPMTSDRMNYLINN